MKNKIRRVKVRKLVDIGLGIGSSRYIEWGGLDV